MNQGVWVTVPWYHSDYFAIFTYFWVRLVFHNFLVVQWELNRSKNFPAAARQEELNYFTWLGSGLSDVSKELSLSLLELPFRGVYLQGYHPNW